MSNLLFKPIFDMINLKYRSCIFRDPAEGAKRLLQDEWMFFNTMPQLIPLYEKLREKIRVFCPEPSVKVAKTQISFRSRYVFAAVSLPWRRVRGWPQTYLLVSFGLGHKKESSRIAQAVEAYPNRWTHHVLIQCEEEIDDELIGWLEEAYRFSMTK